MLLDSNHREIKVWSCGLAHCTGVAPKGVHVSSANRGPQMMWDAPRSKILSMY